MMFPAIVYTMTQAIHPAQDQDLTERRGKVPKTTIQVTPHTKNYLDKINLSCIILYQVILYI